MEELHDGVQPAADLVGELFAMLERRRVVDVAVDRADDDAGVWNAGVREDRRDRRREVDDGVGVFADEVFCQLCGRAHEDEVQELLEEFAAIEKLFKERVRNVGDAHLREAAVELFFGALVGDLVDAHALLLQFEVDLESLDGFAAHLLGDIGGDEDDFNARFGGGVGHRVVFMRRS